MHIRQIIKLLLRKAGYDLVRFAPDSDPLAKRRKLLNGYGVNVVLDGA